MFHTPCRPCRAVLLPLLALLPSVAALAGHTRSNDTPLTKVIELLNGMIVKGKEAMHAEQVEYAKYSTWCTETKSSLDNSIKEASQDLVELNAASTKAAADAESLGEEIGELDAELAGLDAQDKNATSVRSEEHKSFLATEDDFSESIDAIKRAIQVLKAKSADVPQSLLEVSKSTLLPSKAKAALAAFLSVHSSADDMAPPEANAYEFQSGSVIDLLENLQHKFQDQLLALQKAEMNSKHNYEVLMQQLTDDTAAAKASVSTKTQAKANRLADHAQAETDREITEKSKAEDEKDLSDTTVDCDMTTEEYNKNQKLRADELEALKEAVSILSSEDVSGNAAKYLPAFVQKVTRTATALSQLRSTSSQDGHRQKAVELLQAQAQKLGDRYLATIAAHVAADPFEKVKQMIKDLIVKLQEQANAEADHNAYCTTELATNKMTREDKSAEVEKLTAQLDELTATSAQLAKDISTLSDEIAEVQGQMAEATTLRQEEKAQNNNTIVDAKAAQVAVEKAKQVLAEYYSAAAASFVQTSHKAPYKGMQTLNGNIMDFLEVVLSDFARLEAETSTSEDQAQAAYEKYMAESKQDISVKDAEMRHKDINKNRADTAAQTTKKELDLTQAELTAAMEYYDKLKPECVDKGLSYADRKLAREQEIQSLKEALLVLNGEDLP